MLLELPSNFKDVLGLNCYLNSLMEDCEASSGGGGLAFFVVAGLLLIVLDKSRSLTASSI